MNRFSPVMLAAMAMCLTACPTPDANFGDEYLALETEVASLRTDLTALQQTVTTANSTIGTLQTDLNTAEETITQHTTSIGGNASDIDANEIAIAANGTTAGSNASSISALATRVLTAEGELDAFDILLTDFDADRYVTLEGYVSTLETYIAVDPEKNEVLVAGANLRINDDAGTPNTGNLIIGHLPFGVNKGKHNLIMGTGHTWDSEGSLIVGAEHDVAGIGNLVSGDAHVVDAEFAGVLGGTDHLVEGEYGAAVGGESNAISSEGGVTVGGTLHEVSGGNSVIVAGSNGTTGALPTCVVLGGNAAGPCPGPNATVLPPLP